METTASDIGTKTLLFHISSAGFCGFWACSYVLGERQGIKERHLAILVSGIMSSGMLSLKLFQKIK